MTDLGGRKPASGTGAKGLSVAQSSRIASFDGLRGAAAFVVILDHYLCLLHPRLTPSMSENPASLVDTPLNLAVNGAFAVAVFFVLSGFVIARTADRRITALPPTVVARYLRLAVPAAASCLFAWVLLSFMPTSAHELAVDAEIPSRWLGYTHQGELASPFRAAYNGLVGIFNHGFSRWNNVLWTLKIELFGSIALYALYSLPRGRVRLALLFAGTVVLTSLTEPSYAAFGLGAALYEGWRSDALPRMIARLGPFTPFAVALSLAVGLLLAIPGDGFHTRNGLPPVDTAWMVGESRGYLHVFAAAFIVSGVLISPVLAKCFRLSPLLWLGRVSFALYSCMFRSSTRSSPRFACHGMARRHCSSSFLLAHRC